MNSADVVRQSLKLANEALERLEIPEFEGQYADYAKLRLARRGLTTAIAQVEDSLRAEEAAPVEPKAVSGVSVSYPPVAPARPWMRKGPLA